jgi:hypothetical protein
MTRTRASMQVSRAIIFILLSTRITIVSIMNDKLFYGY